MSIAVDAVGLSVCLSHDNSNKTDAWLSNFLRVRHPGAATVLDLKGQRSRLKGYPV